MVYTKKIFAATLLLLGVAFIANAQPKKVVADKIIAVVGDRIILKSDIWNSIRDAQRQGTEVPDGAECMIMEQALVSKVLMLQAQKDSLPVSDEDVEANLDNRIREYVSRLGTKEALEEAAGKTIYQLKDETRESIKEQMLAEAMQKKIVENVKVTPTEVKAFFDKIPKDSLPFYESELEVGQIVLYPKASRDLEEYIVAEMNNYKKQIETKMATIEQLAKQYSQDPGVKTNGGKYEINRNEKSWDPVFLTTAFRLKEGEISAPVKGAFGYHLIQMIKKNGDDAIVCHILRTPPVTDVEINMSKNKLDTIRTSIMEGKIGFNEAAKKYTEDPNAKFAGPFELGRDGSTNVTIDQLDKEIVATLTKLNVGDFSQPVQFVGDRGKTGVRIVYLKSRSEPHRMNLKDDYSKIAQHTLEEKKGQAVDKWLKKYIPTYYIMVDPEFSGNCPNMTKYVSTDSKGF